MAKLENDIAIRVRDVHKDFHLPHTKDDSIKHKAITAFRKKDKGADINHALRGISFDVKKGEFFGIVGRNGSGKSTLLKIISKIYQPTTGTSDYNGKLVAFIELGVGFNPQLSGRENVYLNAAMLGFSRKETDAMYDEIVAFAELEDFMELDLKNYSSGMKVRLAFSVAIRANADILVLDEVLAVGDADFQRKCHDYFKNLKEAHKTIVLVSHSMGTVREYCDRAILIEDGKIAHAGDADKVADDYLKLFNKSSGDNRANSDNRWGDGSVVIKDFKTDISDRNIKFCFNLESVGAPVKDVVFGFRVKDSRNKLLAGANNLNVSGAQKMNFAANEHKSLQFTMPNVFGNGTYKLGATVRLSDGVTTCDNWDDMTIFTNNRSEVYYPILCPAELIISK